MTNLVPSGITVIDARILIIRGQRVMLDVDIARLFGVSTKRLNQQVKRQQERFPPDFMFRLTKSEKAEVVTNCDHLRKLRFSATMPLAFTEHGSLMLANVIRSPTAFQVSVAIVRAFIRLREAMASHRDLATKLDALERVRPSVQSGLRCDSCSDESGAKTKAPHWFQTERMTR